MVNQVDQQSIRCRCTSGKILQNYLRPMHILQVVVECLFVMLAEILEIHGWFHLRFYYRLVVVYGLFLRKHKLWKSYSHLMIVMIERGYCTSIDPVHIEFYLSRQMGLRCVFMCLKRI